MEWNSAVRVLQQLGFTVEPTLLGRWKVARRAHASAPPVSRVVQEADLVQLAETLASGTACVTIARDTTFKFGSAKACKR